MSIVLNPKKIRKSFLELIYGMQQHVEDFVNSPGVDFTRKRLCTFYKTITTIIAMECHNLDKEIMSIFTAGKKKYSRENLVTASAFVQARGKINDAAFPELFTAFNHLFPFLKTKDGMHILGVDGSDVNVPADINDCSTLIPYNSKKGGYHQMHINCCYDLLEQRYSDVVIQPRAEVNEVSAACEMVDRKSISGICLYIADRAYSSYKLMAHIINKGDYFLIRLRNIYSKNSPWKNIVPPEGQEFDLQTKILMTRSRKKANQDPAIYKHIHSTRDFDLIKKGDTTSEYEIPFRLIALKLDNGTIEYLITNLPKKYDSSDIKDYYHMRWNIEESFLFLKYGISLNYFHSIKRSFISQEIYAKLILYNYISLLISCVELTTNKDLKYEYKVAYMNAITIGRDFLLGRIKTKDVIPLLKSYITPIRPNRTYPRKMRSQRLCALQHRH